MEDNDVCNGAFEEIDESIVKIESMETEQNFESESLQSNLVPMAGYPMGGCNTIILPKHRNNYSKKSLDIIKSPSSNMSKMNYSTADLKVGFRKDRFRPIRPKPLQPGTSVLRHKSFGMPSMLNMPALASNRVIVAMPSKDKIRYVPSVEPSIKTNNCTKLDNSNIGNITSMAKEITKEVSKEKIDKNINENSNNVTNNKVSRKIKPVTPSLSHKGSIELFFESMAQTVLNLPREVQADIKMQICKIVTMAEMKYCGSQMDCKTDET